MNKQTTTQGNRRSPRLWALALVACSALLFSGCSAKHVPELKAAAPKVWADAGYEVVGYEGFEYGAPGAAWGGKVWHIVRRKGDDRVTYHGFITKWGDEYHIYNLQAIDAIKPQ